LGHSGGQRNWPQQGRENHRDQGGSLGATHNV
jgi:hypothetical protein